jgi:hypothetical protein
MKARLCRKSVAGWLLVACATSLVLLSGCHSSSKAVATGTTEVCPGCEAETRIQPITGLTYTTCICPSCEKVSTLDSSTRARVEAYVGGPAGDTVHVCDDCKAIVEVCSTCRSR